MKDFFTYILNMLLGRNMIFYYELPLKDEWDLFKARLKAYYTSDVHNDIYLCIHSDEIHINEFFDSNLRNRGSSKVINNESYCRISRCSDKLQITIEIYRAFQSRLITIFFVILNIIMLVISIITIYAMIVLGILFNQSIFVFYFIVLIMMAILILIWQMSREHHQRIFKEIQGIVDQIETKMVNQNKAISK